MFLSRTSAVLYLAFIQLGNTYLIAFIYVQIGLLKSKWIKSWSGKKIKPYCSSAQAVYLGCHVMQAMGILLCKRHWEFHVAAQPAAMDLADVRDAQPHPSTFDLMFHSFLPSLNNHLATAEAQCTSADGSKPFSELQGQELNVLLCRQQNTHSFIPSPVPLSSHRGIFCLNVAFPLQQAVNAKNRLEGAGGCLSINTILCASKSESSQASARQERTPALAVKGKRLLKPFLVVQGSKILPKKEKKIMWH